MGWYSSQICDSTMNTWLPQAKWRKLFQKEEEEEEGEEEEKKE